jgi:drug/metabolite transporter (DMT)-like permease
MSAEKIAILVTVLLSAVGVLADYFLKLASETAKPLASKHFYFGLLTYSSLAFGWVFVLRHLKLSHIGVYYCVATLLLLVALGVFVFKETLQWQEMLGVCLAVVSVLLLARWV